MSKGVKGLLLLLAVAVLAYGTAGMLGFGCPAQRLTGVPCPVRAVPRGGKRAARRSGGGPSHAPDDLCAAAGIPLRLIWEKAASGQ